jgi:hypothetical protein
MWRLSSPDSVLFSDYSCSLESIDWRTYLWTINFVGWCNTGLYEDIENAELCRPRRVNVHAPRCDAIVQWSKSAEHWFDPLTDFLRQSYHSQSVRRPLSSLLRNSLCTSTSSFASVRATLPDIRWSSASTTRPEYRKKVLLGLKPSRSACIVLYLRP